MASIASIRDKKDLYEEHMQRHRCLVGDGCEARVQHWLTYQREAEIWGGYKVDKPAEPEVKPDWLGEVFKEAEEGIAALPEWARPRVHSPLPEIDTRGLI